MSLSTRGGGIFKLLDLVIKMQNKIGQELPGAAAELYFPCGFLVVNEITELFFLTSTTKMLLWYLLNQYFICICKIMCHAFGEVLRAKIREF